METEAGSIGGKAILTGRLGAAVAVDGALPEGLALAVSPTGGSKVGLSNEGVSTDGVSTPVESEGGCISLVPAGGVILEFTEPIASVRASLAIGGSSEFWLLSPLPPRLNGKTLDGKSPAPPPELLGG